MGDQHDSLDRLQKLVCVLARIREDTGASIQLNLGTLGQWQYVVLVAGRDYKALRESVPDEDTRSAYVGGSINTCIDHIRKELAHELGPGYF